MSILVGCGGTTGCGGSPDPGPIDSATEKAAEAQLQKEAAREGQARPRTTGKTPPPTNPDDD